MKISFARAIFKISFCAMYKNVRGNIKKFFQVEKSRRTLWLPRARVFCAPFKKKVSGTLKTCDQ